MFVGPAELPPPSCRKVKQAKKETLVRDQKKWGMNTVKRTKHDPNSPSHLLEADLHVVQAILYRLPMSRRASPPESQLTPAIPVLTTCFCFAAFCCAVPRMCSSSASPARVLWVRCWSRGSSLPSSSRCWPMFPLTRAVTSSPSLCSVVASSRIQANSLGGSSLQSSCQESPWAQPLSLSCHTLTIRAAAAVL